WSSVQYWVPRYLMFGYFAFSCAAKPCARWSVVLIPGLTLIAPTSPEPPIAFASASAAALPPPTLSLATFVTAIGLLMHVSTVITAIPALIARCIGALSAALAVGPV